MVKILPEWDFVNSAAMMLGELTFTGGGNQTRPSDLVGGSSVLPNPSCVRCPT